MLLPCSPASAKGRSACVSFAEHAQFPACLFAVRQSIDGTYDGSSNKNQTEPLPLNDKQRCFCICRHLPYLLAEVGIKRIKFSMSILPPPNFYCNFKHLAYIRAHFVLPVKPKDSRNAGHKETFCRHGAGCCRAAFCVSSGVEPSPVTSGQI